MSKYKLDSPAGTPLDPFAFENQFSKPKIDNSNDFTGVADQLEFVAPEKVDAGLGTLGNAGFAQQVIAESKAQDQSSLDLIGKGIFNVAKTIGIEVAKTPGYAAGLIGAIGNETLGDGKNSMSMIVDNAWINAFEQLDQAAKEAVPVYMSKQVQEGNLLDKLGSGAWWATTGAEGLGFMLAMFAPGAAAKALKIGSGIASAGEGLANLAPSLGKWATGKGLMAAVGEGSELAFKYTKDFARNANGYASAIINTTLEASAEAANTFDNVKNNYIQQGLSEDEAKAKAGEAASAVFKGNIALLAVSNYLDEMWIWKTIGSAGEKEAAQSMLSKVMKNGEVDFEALKKIPQELTRAKVLKDAGKNVLKNFAKEGVYEEGSQTTLQQNVEKGKIGENFLDNLYNVGSSYFDDFTNNTELHESIFLGKLFAGGASIIGTVQENKSLRSALYGSEARTTDNSYLAKMGLLPETKAQKGLINLVTENHINQFRSYKDFIKDDGTGPQLDEQKLIEANVQQVDNLRTNALYDIATAQGNKLGQEIYGQYLSANYAQSFLGQEGGQEIFQQHVKNQVLPAWQKRFEDTFGRPASAKETADYERNFTKSGDRIFEAHKVAEQTNYPERYFYESSKEYQDFRQEYFHNKFQALIGADAIKERRNQIQQELQEVGLNELELADINLIQDPIKRQHAEFIADEVKELNNTERQVNEYYPKFFTKEGVKEMFEAFKSKKKAASDFAENLQKENETLRQEVDNLPTKNSEELNRLLAIAQQEGYTLGDIVPFVDKRGNLHSLEQDPDTGKWNIYSGQSVQEIDNYKGDLSDLRLEHNDVSKEDYDKFKQTGEASFSTLKKIAKKVADGKPLSIKEQEIANQNADELSKFNNKSEVVAKSETTESISTTVEGIEPEVNDAAIEAVNKKKGVNLYPSTGRNLLNEKVKIGDDLFAEKINPSPSQQLWFKTLDEEVSKDPTAYTVQVIRLDDKSNSELHNQIIRDANPEDRKDGDLYVVLHKDGKPVVKGGTPIDPETVKIRREQELKNINLGLSDRQRILIADIDSNIATVGNDAKGDSVQEITLTEGEYQEVKRQFKLYNLDSISAAEFNSWRVDFSDRVLNRVKKEIIAKYDAQLTNSSHGNYVFTGLFRPETLYPLTKTGTPARFVLAERIILENYLLHLGMPKLNIDSLSKADKDKLKLQGIDKPTRDNIMSAAFIHSRSEYSKWYDNLQEAAFQKQTERQQSLQAIREIPISPSIELVEKLSLDTSKEMFEKGKENNWTLEEVLERISLSKTQRQLVLEQNANLVRESVSEVKPELKLEFVSVKDLVDSDNPVESRDTHNKLKQRYDKILDLLNCI